MEIYCICMFYLNEQTICPILTGIHIKYCAKYVSQFLTVYVLFVMCVRGLKTYCYISNTQLLVLPYLIHARLCQKNFPNVYKTYGVTVQSKSCLMFLHSIFKVQVFAKVMGSVIQNYKSDKHGVSVIIP